MNIGVAYAILLKNQMQEMRSLYVRTTIKPTL